MTTIAEHATIPNGITIELPLERLHLPEDNVRADVGDVTELAKSIEQQGIIEPIIVTPRDGQTGYLVVCGSRRVAAAAVAGVKTVPAIVREFTEEERIQVMIVENLQRSNLTPLEEGRAFQRLADLPMSQRAIAEKLSVSQGHVSKRIALLALPQVAHDALDSGGITIEQAIELAKIGNAKAVTKAVKDALAYPGAAANTIASAVRDATNARTRDKKIADLQAEGKAAVAMRTTWQAPKGHAIVGNTMYVARDRVNMEPAKHRKLACHVTGVHTDYYGKIELTDLCNDPAKHPQPEAPSSPTRGGMSAKLVKHRQALEEAAERRIEFLRQLCAKPLPKNDLLELVTLAIVAQADWVGEYETAATILELEETDEKGDVVSSSTIGEFADNGPAFLSRAAAAIAIDFLNEQLHGYYGRNGWEEAGPYFEILKRKGYEISPAEQLEIDGKAPR
jgi:ParB/RepB/Spo0J family partition protein